MPVPGNAPKDNPYGDGDVQGVFGAVLRYFQAEVGSIDHLLAHPLDLVAEDVCKLAPLFGVEISEAGGIFRLFDTDNRVAFLLELPDKFHGILPVLPIHAELGSESRFMYLGRGWAGTDSAEIDSSQSEGIAGSEDRTHVVQAAYVVKDDHRSRFFGGFELFDAQTVQFAVQKFSEHNFQIGRKKVTLWDKNNKTI